MSGGKVSGSEALERTRAALVELGLPADPCVPLAGDGSNRAYVRVIGAAGPRIAMVMAAAEPHRQAEEVGAGVNDDRIPFLDVARSLSRAGLPVPEIYGHARRSGVILLEDLGDVALADAWADGRPPLAAYSEAFSQLVRFQTMAADDSLIFERRYDLDLWHWEWRHFTEYGVEARYGVRLASPDAEAVDALARSMAESIAAMPAVPVHRDFHSRNLLIHEGRVRWIDFQDALLGPALYDPASLLYDAYVDLSPDDRRRLLDVYGEAASAAGVALPQPLAPSLDLVACHRMAKAAGRFEFFLRVKQLDGYTRHIPGLLARIDTASSVSGADERLREYVDRLACYVPEWSSRKKR